MRIIRSDSQNEDFKKLVKLLDQELVAIYGDEQAFYAQFNHTYTIKTVILCYVDGIVVGCGAFREFDQQTAEIKRMYVLPKHRNQGFAGEILCELEHWAFEMNYQTAILETGIKQPFAVRLYEKSGYTRIPNYGQYSDAESSICLQKSLTD